MSPPAAVYDSNVLFAAIYGGRRGRATPPVVAWRAVVEGAVRHATSPRLLEELHRALTAGSSLGPDLVAAATEFVADASRIVKPATVPDVLRRDPHDNHVLACAAAADAEWLVTGNLKHFEELGEGPGGRPAFQGIGVVSPRDFLAALARRLPPYHRFHDVLHWVP